jgi:hypothetical protein
MASDKKKFPRFCLQPDDVNQVFEDRLRSASLDTKAGIGLSSKLWVSGQTIKWWAPIHIDKNVVRDAFAEWAKWVNLNFVEQLTSLTADIRIGFNYSSGSWSYIGTDATNIAVTKNTMNFGWSLQNDFGTALHEIGHAVGLYHEHQSPHRTLVWDMETIYQYFQTSQGWNPSTVDSNVVNTASVDATSGYDLASIMHYPLPPEIILSPEPYATSGTPHNLVVSPVDKIWGGQVYPHPMIVEDLPLNTLISETDLMADQQVRFDVIPVPTSAPHVIAVIGEGTRQVTVWKNESEFHAGAVNLNSSRSIVLVDAQFNSTDEYHIVVRNYSGSEFHVVMWQGQI